MNNQTARERAEAIIDSLEFQDGERDELVPIVERAITAAEQAAREGERRKFEDHTYDGIKMTHQNRADAIYDSVRKGESPAVVKALIRFHLKAVEIEKVVTSEQAAFQRGAEAMRTAIFDRSSNVELWWIKTIKLDPPAPESGGAR